MNIHVVVSHIAALYVWQNSGRVKLSSSTKLCLTFSLCCENGKVLLCSVASCPELLTLVHSKKFEHLMNLFSIFKMFFVI